MKYFVGIAFSILINCAMIISCHPPIAFVLVVGFCLAFTVIELLRHFE